MLRQLSAFFLIFTLALPVQAERLVTDFDRVQYHQLHQAVTIRNWQEALRILDQLIDTNPPNLKELLAYRAQLLALAASSSAPSYVLPTYTAPTYTAPTRTYTAPTYQAPTYTRDSSPSYGSTCTYVDGYRRSNGTYVRGHYRGC